ncbi:hypothetical protein CVT24_005969 [Panaeolus cyanescens]|uniref:Uncharacterized protein n=1 Tax=Panaeolus cyanescens TaxID=181874 RepID=A0A409V8U8_9AGAR|nr:hypothetical protein CVT24_005969 [Panaeolus cyanescens]
MGKNLASTYLILHSVSLYLEFKSRYSKLTTFVVTQEDVNRQDEERRKAAMRDLVESWMDRLQLISVITTFFASTEAGLLTITTPNSRDDPETNLNQVTNIGLMGALIVHSSAAIISFLAAFILIRHKLQIAKQEEIEVEREEEIHAMRNYTHHSQFNPPIAEASIRVETSNVNANGPTISHTVTRNSAHRSPTTEQPGHFSGRYNTDPVPGPVRVASPYGSGPFSTAPIFSTNPHLVQVGPRLWGDQVPTHLLSRFHTLCIALSLLGFVLALMGMLCFAWDRLALSAGVSASIFMAICLVSGLGVLIIPEGEGRNGHIYVNDNTSA